MQIKQNKYLVLIILMMLGFYASAQKKLPVRNDTVVIIIDTTHAFVEFTKVEGDSLAKQPPHWYLGIKGHYFDERWPADADEARMDISHFNYPFRCVTAPYTCEITRKKLYRRFDCVPDAWIHEQADLYIIQKRVGGYWFELNNFVVFKSDLEDYSKDTVKLYRVLIAYNEIQQ